MHTYIRTYVHTYVRTHIRAYVHAYVRTYVHAYMRTYVHAYMRTYATVVARSKMRQLHIRQAEEVRALHVARTPPQRRRRYGQPS